MTFDPVRDYEYFQGLWEKKKSGISHTKEMWDERAQEWKQQLDENETFQKSVAQRVEQSAAFLREKGLLKETDSVVDLGCGPGRFVSEFAKTAGHVMGLDISSEMVGAAKEYTDQLGFMNTSYKACDFKTLDIEKEGLKGQFDLVFTSITPAIGTMDSLKKAMELSRGYCFNSCFVEREDEIGRQLALEVLGITHEDTRNHHSQWFYSLFNILWLLGYLPETSYHSYETKEEAETVNDLVHYYSRNLLGNNRDEKKIEKMRLYLESKKDSDGLIRQNTKRTYGWILWDVRRKRDFC